MNKSILYSVTGYTGAHMLKDVRDTDAGTIADVQLIGAELPFSTAIENITPFTLENKFTGGDLIISLAQEAATIYNAEPKRVQRGANIARQPYNIQQAQRDINDQPIKSTLKTLIVKSDSGRGWYVVTKGTCQCKDPAPICKHRIAAFIYRETITRPLAAARRVTPAVILAELEAS